MLNRYYYLVIEMIFLTLSRGCGPLTQEMNQLKRDPKSKATAALRSQDDGDSDDDDGAGGGDRPDSNGNLSRATRKERRDARAKDPPADTATEPSYNDGSTSDVDGSQTSNNAKRGASLLDTVSPAEKRQRMEPSESTSEHTSTSPTRMEVPSNEQEHVGGDEPQRKTVMDNDTLPQSQTEANRRNDHTDDSNNMDSDIPNADVDAAVSNNSANNRPENRGQADQKRDKKEKKKSKIPFEQYQTITKMLSLHLRQQVCAQSLSLLSVELCFIVALSCISLSAAFSYYCMSICADPSLVLYFEDPMSCV